MLHNRLRAAAGNRDGIPTDGLVAWYTMDNISGSTLVDEMGNYDATIDGATQVVGVDGQALSFDGSNDKVTSLGYVSGDTDMAWSFWFKTTQTSTGVLIGQDMASNYRAVFVGSSGIAFFSRTSTGGYKQTDAISGYQDGNWHHATVSQIGNVIHFRINDTIEKSLDMGSRNDATTKSYLGWNGGSGSDNFWHSGQLDQVRIYNRELDTSEKTLIATEF